MKLNSPMSIGSRFRDEQELDRLIGNLSRNEKLALAERLIGKAKLSFEAQDALADDSGQLNEIVHFIF